MSLKVGITIVAGVAVYAAIRFLSSKQTRKPSVSGPSNTKNVQEEAPVTSLTRVALLKHLDKVSGETWKAQIQTLPESLRSKLMRVVFGSDMSGIEEFSEEFYDVLRHKARRNKLCRNLIIETLEEQKDKTGFTPFEQELIKGTAAISNAYDEYYFQWLLAVQDEKVAQALEKVKTPDPAFLNSYTILHTKENGDLDHKAFAEHFEGEMWTELMSGFDKCIKKIQAVSEGTAEHKAYIAFMQQYRSALAEKKIEALDPAWEELDRVWMDTKGHIQIVHDIETGYGDPLRVKATPDLSIRFLDETCSDSNENIAMIQKLLMDYFQTRETKLAKAGLTALSNTLAGIYYIPFKTGMSLQFAYSGQSIPNRVNVKTEKGVKIYFDLIETQARVAQNLQFIRKVFANAQKDIIEKYKPDALEQLVWHVAAHEVGHAIYGLASIEEVLKADTVTLLEEPRAELTAMFTLHLLYKRKIINLAELKKHLAHFAVDALRYFAKFESEALEPYIIFQIYAYKVYSSHKYISANDAGELVLDDSRTLPVMEEFSRMFTRVLDLMDESDGAGLEHILYEEMKPAPQFVLDIVAKLK